MNEKLKIGNEYKLFKVSSFLAHTQTTTFKVIDLTQLKATDKPIIKIKNSNGNYERKNRILTIDKEMIIIPLKDCVLKADSETGQFMGNAHFNFLNTEQEIREQLKLNINQEFNQYNYINRVLREENKNEYIKVNFKKGD